jgi:hypothetical protein
MNQGNHNAADGLDPVQAIQKTEAFAEPSDAEWGTKQVWL